MVCYVELDKTVQNYKILTGEKISRINYQLSDVWW